VIGAVFKSQFDRSGQLVGRHLMREKFVISDTHCWSLF
jgi:hypothetical protein